MTFTLTVDRAYGRGRSSVEAVLLAELQGAALATVACVAAGAVVLGAVRIAGTWWWVPAGVALSGLLAAAHQLAPWLLARTGQLQPLTRPGLASALQAFAARVKVPVAGIDEWLVGDGTRATALVAGLGRRRRVLIASEIARGWSDEEITVVVAHELAHHAYGDLWRSLALNAAILSVALGAAQLVVALAGPALALAGPAELAALPLMALVAALVWGLSAPLRLAQSRRHERRADAFALKVTGGTEAFGAAIRRLTARHLAEERPSLLTQWLSASHPPIAERLALAEALREKPAVDTATPRRVAAGGSRAPRR
jgi:Zn-dependent protease with chaperone function